MAADQLDISNELHEIESLVKKVVENDTIVIDEESELCNISQWRKRLNPFAFYGLSGDRGNNDLVVNVFTEIRRNNDPELSDGIFSTCTATKVKEEDDEFATVESNENGDEEPYYLENFNKIIDTVMKNNEATTLFTRLEIDIVRLFGKLSFASKKLYVRLFLRKHKWLCIDKIKYSEIKEDEIENAVMELCKSEFLKDEEALKSLDEILALLSLPDVKSLVTDMKLAKSLTGMTKPKLVKLLKDASKKQRTIFFGKGLSMENIIIKKSKKLLGKSVQVRDCYAEVFTHIINFFSRFIRNNSQYSDSILYTMLQVKIKQIAYPKYLVDKSFSSFENRKKFIGYSNAVELEKEFFAYMEVNDFENAFIYFKKSLHQLIYALKENKQLSARYYLACFTEEYLLVQICRHSLILLEKQKRYIEASRLADILLNFKCIKAKHKGMLWERKIIDHGHLKQQRKVFESIERALGDNDVRGGFRYSFMQRLEKLKKNSEELGCLEELRSFKEIKEEHIHAKILLDTSSSNRAVFMSTDASGDSMSCVEEFVLTHYKQFGFTCGVHDEGGGVMMLYLLLFWDVIFVYLPDTFRSIYQSCPLDFRTDEFYNRRKEMIDSRLKFVYHANEEDLRKIIFKHWNDNFGITCFGANWDVFQDCTEAANVAMCFGGKALSGLCEIFCKDLHTRRGGFPDLLLWNIQTKQVKIIEVKGPGDKLSTKQIIWLEILQYLSIDASVCHVTGIGAKRKRITTE